ncbi:MAG: caspase family protein [Candidatus Bipolaricaulis sp.]|nr:caspase family protein [Candidatus Bipolaricaulis sp.]
MRLGVRSIQLGLVLAASLLLGGCFLFPNELPVALYTATPAEGGTPLYVAFDASDSYDPDGYVSSYSWDFGDGTIASGQTVDHTYTTAGMYSITLRVTDDSGEDSTALGHVTAHQGTTYAIIIGIADYTGLPKLSFTDDDAQSMYTWLRSVGGWSPANMTLLLNSQATVANVVAAVNALDGASAYDTLLFFYSGHGTNTGDDDLFEEIDRLDECLCLYDQTYFRDDSLEALLSQVPMARIVVFIDACYSGGELNSLGAYDEAASWDFVGDLERLAEDRTRDLDRLAKSVVAVSACQYNEYSWELNAVEHGAFTYSLLEALDGLADGQGNRDGITSVEECYAYVAPRVFEIVWSAAWEMQSPQLLDLCPGELGFAPAP